VSALGVALVACTVMVVGFLVFGTIADLKERNDAAREALAAIAKHRDEFLDGKTRMTAQEVRIGAGTPQLTADLEAAAREVGMPIAETNPRAPAPAGKNYLEHTVDVTARQVDLLALTRFLAKVETGARFIVVTKLDIKRRFAEGDKLDVRLTATAFERVKEQPRKRAAGAAKEKS
jgi:hypothetical protein